MIPDAAIEALARVLAEEALFDADCSGSGWDAETDSSDHFMPSARKSAARYLEAADPHMMAGMEWGVFRASDDEPGTPIENRRYKSRESAQRMIDQGYNPSNIWEVRGRTVGEWAK